MRSGWKTPSELCLRHELKINIKAHLRNLLHIRQHAEHHQSSTLPRRRKASAPIPLLIPRLPKKENFSRPERKVLMHAGSRVRLRKEQAVFRENEKLIARLIEKRSNYPAREFATQRQRTEQIINNISRFPYKLYSPNRTFVRLDYEQFIKQSRATGHDAQCELSDLLKSVDEVRQPARRKLRELLYKGPMRLFSGQVVEVECLAQEGRLKIELRESGGQVFSIQLGLREAVTMIERQFGGELKTLLTSIEIKGDQCYIFYSEK